MTKLANFLLLPDCRFCGSTDAVRRHGRAKSGLQRYRCTLCSRTFQVRYIYQPRV